MMGQIRVEMEEDQVNLIYQMLFRGGATAVVTPGLTGDCPECAEKPDPDCYLCDGTRSVLICGLCQGEGNFPHLNLECGACEGSGLKLEHTNRELP